MAIASALLDLVRRRERRGARVVGFEVAIGALTGIVPDSLAFYVEGLSLGTPLEGARLTIRSVPAQLLCGSCGDRYEPERFLRVCPRCGALGGRLLSGEEMDLLRVSYALEEAVARGAGASAGASAPAASSAIGEAGEGERIGVGEE
jgi:hydrogenase nickel incorporation protein HypA/HybF